MPYTIRKRDDRFCVVKADDPDGKTFGCHDTEEKAKGQIAAIEANEAGKSIWITREQMARVCPACALSMEQKGLARISLDSLKATSEGEQLTDDDVRVIDALHALIKAGVIQIEWLPEPPTAEEKAAHRYHSAKMESCLKHLEDQGADAGKAHRICYWSLGGAANKAIGGSGESLDQQSNEIREAFRASFPPAAAAAQPAAPDYWIRDVFTDHVIVEQAGEIYKVNYSRNADGTLAFEGKDKWTKVEQQYVPAQVPASNALKAISKTDDQLVVGNYLILFGGRDLTGIGNVNETGRRIGDPALMKKNIDGSIGERFSPQVDIDSAYTFKGVIDEDWEHGSAEIDADEVLGYANLKSARRDDRGIFAERVLNRRNGYVKWLEELIDEGLIGTSTEAIEGKAVRQPDGTIVKWPLKRDTLTVMPFDPRMMKENSLRAVKALGIALPEGSAEGTAPQGRPAPQAQGADNNSHAISKTNGGPIMDEKELKALQERLAALETEPLTVEQRKSLKVIAERFATLETEHAAMKKALEQEPPKGTPGLNVQPAQKYPYKPFVKDAKGIVCDASGFGEYLQDVMVAMSGNPSVSPRLANWADLHTKALKAASGLNVAIPSQGGFFVQTDHSNELVRMMIDEDDIMPLLHKLPLGANADSVTINGVDETSRASTIWGGILAYWVQEATAPSASKPKFREIKLEAKGLAALYYATDKLLRLAPALGAEVSMGFREAMLFKVKDALVNGTGAGKPLGILQSGSIVSITKETNQVADTIVHENVSKMKARLFPSSFRKSIWLANGDCQPQLDLLSFAIGTAGVLSPYIRYDDTGVMRIHGRPVVFSEHCQTLGDSGDFILWDPDSYYYIDLGAIGEVSSIHVAFTTFDTCFRFGYFCDGQPKLASALTPAHGSNTLTTHVKIDARA